MAFFLIEVVSWLTPWLIPINGISSLLFAALLIFWAFYASLRIMQKNVRIILWTGAFVTSFLFVLRYLRWNVFADNEIVSRFLWYLMYVPFLMVPLLSFMAALCAGKRHQKRPLRHFSWLFFVCILLIAMVLTNDLTGAIFTIVYDKGKMHYHYNPLYFVLIVWEFSFTIATFAVLMYYCKLSMCRRKWYIPLAIFFVGLAALVAYMINGGSFYFRGINLYNVQEVWAYLFVALWEAFIHIGFLPSNSGYAELFEASHLGAAIQDESGKVVYSSTSYDKETENGYENASLVRRSQPIRGGSVTWLEDHLNILAANDELSKLADETIAENELIEEENRIAAEKTAYEERNRLYDTIASSLHSSLSVLKMLLSSDGGSYKEKEKLIAAQVLGVYVKRRANLTLLADREREISSTELFLSIKESFEYMELSGTACEIREENPGLVKAEYLLLAFDYYEGVVEASSEPMCACSVVVTGNPFSLVIETELRPYVTVPDELEDRIRSAGLTIRYKEEDETVRLEVSDCHFERM